MTDAVSDPAGPGLSLRVSGPGVSLDPATGGVAIPGAALAVGVELVVGEIRFRLTALPALVAPALAAVPALAGTGVVGSPVEADPGRWTGTPLPELALQWRADGAAIPGATGAVFVPTAAEEGRDLDCLVTATNPAGSASAATGPLRVTPLLMAPALVAAPALAGTGVVGGPVEVDPGQWTGIPAPEVTLQWRADGAAIPGATGTVFVPTAAEDERALDCLVTAANAAGAAGAAAGPLRVVQPAPAVAAAIADLALVQGEPAGRVEAAAHFSGGGLRFAVEGAGAALEAGGEASGAIRIPTDALFAEEPVVVTARNSGGAATAVFRVSVAAAPVLPAAPVALGQLPDLVLEQDTGERTVSTQAGFAGEGLSFALAAAPAGVAIESGSGLVRIPTDKPVAAGRITVRASNAAGAAEQGFSVTVRSTATDFAVATSLAELASLHFTAPTRTLQPEGYLRVVPSAAGRVHSSWSKAQGDGRYRCLARWSAAATAGTIRPFSFNARLSKVAPGWTGLKVDAVQPSSGARSLEIAQYVSASTKTTVLATAAVAWEWNAWYWFEVELGGTAVRARLYPEAAPVPPAWQVTGTATFTDAGAFGPGGFPLSAGGPNIDIRRLEYVPLTLGSEIVPPAALAADWSLGQFTESK